MIEIRPLRDDEIEEAKKLIPVNCGEPTWIHCWGVFWNGTLEHIFGLEQFLRVEPFYSKGKHTLSGFAAMTWIDGFLRAKCWPAFPGYEFFVKDGNETFKKFARENLPLTEGHEEPGSYFFRKFEV